MSNFRKPSLSMRGEVVDFSVLAIKNAKQVALGNARLNAKGDIVGQNGVILKTQEQIDAEWAMKKAKSSIPVSIDIKAPPTNNIQSDVQQQQPTQNATSEDNYPSIEELVASGVIPTKRKIVEK
jgi:hypothetical protein